MSPRKIESRYNQFDGIKVTEIKEKAEGFPVGPADAGRILGMPRTTLFRYDGPDIHRETVHKGKKTDEVRVYSDEALLRIAVESGRVNIRQDDVTGLTMLSAEGCDTLLNIKWAQTQESMNAFYSNRANKERR